MSTPKIRGKSGIHINDSIIIAATGGASNSHSNALLKIESVVPKLTNRTTNPPTAGTGNGTGTATGHSNRLKTFHRSHSTLSAAYLKKVNDKRVFIPREAISERFNHDTSDHQHQQQLQPQQQQLQQQQQQQYQQHQLQTASHETAAHDSTLTIQNGISTIRRSQKDREKHPDRINLDRKGLSSIPVIDDEPNLRLLSLQHNLINTFHIPPDADPNNNNPADGKLHPVEPSTPTRAPLPAPVPVPTANSSTNGSASSVGSQAAAAAPTPTIGSPYAGTNKTAKQFLRQKSTSRSQLFMNNNNISYISSKMAIGSKQQQQQQQQQQQNGGSIQQASLSAAAAFLQKPATITLNAQQKNLLKKSNSFISGANLFPPSPTIGASGTGGNLLKLKAGKLLLTPSFSIDNLNSISELPGGHGGDTNGHYSSSANNSGKTTPTNPLVSPLLLADVTGFALPPRYNLANLVFLDLYDNQIEKISNLDGLKSLTVLLLGKNRITDISGLASLKGTLRVLDLHGNKISNITAKINQLQELKSLNLAGNMLRHVQVQDFASLFSLKELNLKRNRIKKIGGFDDLRNLERLWLCHNDLQCVEDMSAIAKAINLKEVTIENNPVSLAGDCVSFLVSYLPGLVSLSQMQITEQVRRAASAWRKNKELSDTKYSNLSSDVCQSIRREEIISNARTNWELLRSQQSLVCKNALRNINTVTMAKEVELEVTSNISESSRNGKSRKSGTGNNPTSNSPVIANGGRTTRTVKKAPNKKLVRSSSQDNSGSQVSEQGGEDYFRLPPILAPFLEQTATKAESTHSSIGANADSSVSSGFSSDNDQLIPKDLDQEVEKEQTLVECSSTPEKASESPTAPETDETEREPECKEPEKPPAEPPPVIEEQVTPVDEVNMDKLSTLSTVSTKTSSESVITNFSSDLDSTRAHKPKTITPVKRYGAGTLTRTQTNRNATIVAGVASLTNSSNLASPAPNPSNGGSSSNSTFSGVSTSTYVPPPPPAGKSGKSNEREREQGGDYLIEICGRYLNVYGLGALRFIDKQWNMQKACDVHTVKFSYINFNSITAILCRIKVRFVNAENFIFRETNITCLGQINALAESQGVASLTIDPEGNPIAGKAWRNYAIYRLSHWGLKQINGIDVTADEVQTAEHMYAGLSDLVLWSLPEGLLQPLLQRLRLEETAHASKMTAKEWLMQADPSLKNVVGKEALQWKKHSTNQDDTAMRAKGKAYFARMLENTCNAVEKLQRLETMWPSLLLEMIRNTLIDYSQIDVYVKSMLVEVLRTQ